MELVCAPIGFMRCQTTSRALAYRQSGGVVEMLPAYRQALSDLEQFSRIWLLWWFDRNSTWRPKVLPPGGRVGRKGLFATRSPHRPNPLGLTAVPLLEVRGLELQVGAHDLVDGTPILDVKPYIPSCDAFPEESSGWLAEVHSQEPTYAVELPDEVPPELVARITELLSVDPRPHRTRRIVPFEKGFRLSLGSWRIFYRIEGNRVLVERLWDSTRAITR